MKVTTIASSSDGNCYVVDDGTTPLLLECGLPMDRTRERLEASGYSLTDIRAVLVSHEHGDHARSALKLLALGHRVLATRGTLEALGYNVVRAPITAGHVVRVGSWAILPFELVHDAEEPVGFLMQSDGGERLLYLTDTAYTEHRFAKLTHIMVAANYSERVLEEATEEGETNRHLRRRIRESHMSLERVIEMLRANDLSRVVAIYLLHLSDRHSNAEEFQREVESATGVATYIASR